MGRIKSYRKFMTDNGTENVTRVIPLTDGQLKGFIRFCKNNDTPSGYDRKTGFFVYSGLYGYSVRFIRTSFSGAFARINKYFCPRTI